MTAGRDRREQVSIRVYAPSDRAAVEEITSASWSGASMAELREQKVGLIDGAPWQRHKVDSVLQAIDREPEHALVAVAGGAVIGYATFRVQGDVGTVADNSVAPNWRGRGVATLLISTVLEELKSTGVRLLEVQTFQHDLPARKVYEKFGFEEVASTIHYSLDPTAPSIDREEQSRSPE